MATHSHRSSVEKGGFRGLRPASRATSGSCRDRQGGAADGTCLPQGCSALRLRQHWLFCRLSGSTLGQVLLVPLSLKQSRAHTSHQRHSTKELQHEQLRTILHLCIPVYVPGSFPRCCAGSSRACTRTAPPSPFRFHERGSSLSVDLSSQE